MQVAILGKYGPFPPANGATSGLLLTEGQTHILIGCGSGVLSRMQRIVAIPQLSAVVLTHLTSDHIADMPILRSALTNMKARGALPGGPMKVFLPGSPRSEFAAISTGQNVFESIELQQGMGVHIGDLTMSFHAMRHPIPSFGVLAIGQAGRTIAYTGDTSLHDGLLPFAAGADLFLCDAALLDRERPGMAATHMTALQAGIVARDAGVERLILTNLQPYIFEDDVRSEAARHFPRAEIAKEMQTYFP